jgi:predicted amidohydrolase
MLTRLLSFGVQAGDVMARATVCPARAPRRDDFGRLAEGGIGDATILRPEAGSFELQDVDGRTRTADRRLVAVGAVRAGECVAA